MKMSHMFRCLPPDKVHRWEWLEGQVDKYRGLAAEKQEGRV